MFINFSNHPSCFWSERQKEAARAYGDIVDVPFPPVSPMASHEKLYLLASKYVAKIRQMGDAHTMTVHVMGEMTFVFLVVTQLKELGIKCIASTTERNATEYTDGVKLSEFSFVKFREY